MLLNLLLMVLFNMIFHKGDIGPCQLGFCEQSRLKNSFSKHKLVFV